MASKAVAECCSPMVSQNPCILTVGMKGGQRKAEILGGHQTSQCLKLVASIEKKPTEWLQKQVT